MLINSNNRPILSSLKFFKSRILAKSSQDLRELYKEKSTTFDQMASKAELASLIGKGFNTGTKNSSSVLIS